MTILNFYQEAKNYFSIEENKIDTVYIQQYPKALCSFLRRHRWQLHISDYHIIENEISDIIIASNIDIDANVYNVAYFSSHNDRINFINDMIKKHTDG